MYAKILVSGHFGLSARVKSHACGIISPCNSRLRPIIKSVVITSRMETNAWASTTVFVERIYLAVMVSC